MPGISQLTQFMSPPETLKSEIGSSIHCCAENSNLLTKSRRPHRVLTYSWRLICDELDRLHKFFKLCDMSPARVLHSSSRTWCNRSATPLDAACGSTGRFCTELVAHAILVRYQARTNQNIRSIQTILTGALSIWDTPRIADA